MLVAVYLLSTSRTGRAWRSLREDSLAAEMMGMPVNRLRLIAFACGAGVAGLTGTLFASLNTAVFAADFDTTLLITVYAMLILGGAGSLGGVILGRSSSTSRSRPCGRRTTRRGSSSSCCRGADREAAAVEVVRDRRRRHDRVRLRRARDLRRVLAERAEGQGYAGGRSARRSRTGCRCRRTRVVGNWAFVALVALVLLLTTVRPVIRNLLLIPTLYLGAFVWNTRLAAEPSITRLILIGVILIVLMNVRPQGWSALERVEIA